MKYIVSLFITLFCLSCAKKEIKVEGFYADHFYKTKQLGHNWVAVKIKEIDAETINVIIFSSKKNAYPGCSLNVIAKEKQPNVYTTIEHKIPIEFIFSEDGLSVTSMDREQRKKLNYFCFKNNTIESFYKRAIESDN